MPGQTDRPNGNTCDHTDTSGAMSGKAITVEEVMRPLSPEERQEVLREDFKVPLEYYLEGINANPQTTQKSKEDALLKVRQAAVKRVAIRNEVRTNPDVLKTPADNPLVITGFHRCGTTMLHRLLESDPRLLSPMLWEMMEPVPPGRVKDYRETPRYLKAKTEFEKTIYSLSESHAKHEYSLELTDECMSILQDYFLELPEIHHNKAMSKWEQFVYFPPKEHVTSAYQYYKNVLQCIFYKTLGPDQRILVKSGMHPLFLDTHREVFPDAKYVLIYRNPCEMVPSLASLASDFGKRQGYVDDGLGKRMVRYYGLVTSRGVKFFQTLPKLKFVILGYSEMVKDPMAAVKKIYSHFNMPLTPEAIQAMQQHIPKNKQNKHGQHKYSLEDFGLTVEDVQKHLKDYIEFFRDGTETMP